MADRTMAERTMGRPTLVTDEFIAAVQLLKDTGMGTRNIAKALGVSRNTVGKALRQARSQ